VVLEQLPSAVQLQFLRQVELVRTPVGGVEAHLSSGEIVRCDVLVGADGIHSRIRALVFGDGSSWIRLLGLHTASFVIEAPNLNRELADELHILSVPGRQVGLYPLRDGKVAASFVRRAAADTPRQAAHQSLIDAFGDLGWHVPDVLERARALPSLLYEHVGQVVMAHWCRGRIALLGDACQAVSVLPGQGASLSLAAAHVLAEELCSGREVKDAVAAYERRVRPPLIHMRRAGRRAADWLVPETSAGLVARNAALRLASRPGLSRLLRPVVEAAREDLLAPLDSSAASVGNTS
jgi:2-polyprenyl-6-methoxyphenol hydroxylase-like FAD-dependent oxidoreductase